MFFSGIVYFREIILGTRETLVKQPPGHLGKPSLKLGHTCIHISIYVPQKTRDVINNPCLIDF